MTAAGFNGGANDRAARARLNVCFTRHVVWIRTIVLVFAALSPLCALAAAQNRQNTAPLSQAEAALSKNDPETARRILSAHLSVHPSDIPARLLLAESFIVAGNAQAAEEQYRTVLRSTPNNYLALAGLGELYKRTGQLDKAEPMLVRAVKYSRQEPELRIELATVQARLHKFPQARNTLEKVTAPRENVPRIAFFRLKAAIAEGLGDASSAASEMENALALDRSNSTIQVATAATQLRARNFRRASDLARQTFSESRDPSAGLILLEAQLGAGTEIQNTLQTLRALAFAPSEMIAMRQHTAELLIAHGRYADAVPDLKTVADANPGRPDLAFNLALAQFKAGLFDDALQSAESSRKLHDSAEVEDLIGDIQESRGDILAAVRSYQAAVSFAPGDEHYQLSLALEFIRHQNFEPAKVTLLEAAKSHPNSWQIQLCLGMIEYFTGTKSKAAAMLLHASNLAPKPAVVLAYLGDIEMDEVSPPDDDAVTRICEFADRNPDAGREQLNCGALKLRKDYASRDKSRVQEITRRLTVAAKLLPNEADTHCELGKLYRWTEAWDPALHESELCAKMDPDSAEAHYRLAQILQHSGDAERSRQELDKFQKASQKLADENARRQKTLTTFLYRIEGDAAGQK